MCRERDGSTFYWSLMLEDPRISPSVARVEAPGAGVAGDDCKPCQIEPFADLALGMPEQCSSHTTAPSDLGHVDLFELVVMNHDEAGHVRPDGSHSGAVEKGRNPRTEIDEPAMQ